MIDSILLGDARVVLPAAFTADIMLVDPPYRAHVHDNATSQDQHNGGGVRHNDLGFASLTEELRTGSASSRRELNGGASSIRTSSPCPTGSTILS